uniref:Secreted protein n=1 Tax=Trypanosoma vivax (strain Y486) TaxID=1055687 RepID=G0U1W8_TRYVY|nr:hypothetical protein TVY486_0900910 [Trypanosoma vivax Y486]
MSCFSLFPSSQLTSFLLLPCSHLCCSGRDNEGGRRCISSHRSRYNERVRRSGSVLLHHCLNLYTQRGTYCFLSFTLYVPYPCLFFVILYKLQALSSCNSMLAFLLLTLLPFTF